MVTGQGAPTSSPWEQFGLRHAFGEWGNTNRKESAKARKKRLQGTAKLPKRKNKKKATAPQALFQSHFTAHGGLAYDDAEAFGDLLKNKPSFTWRAGFANVNLLPASARHYKSRQLVTHIREAAYDVFFMNEVGLSWDKLDACDQCPNERSG